MKNTQFEFNNKNEKTTGIQGKKKNHNIQASFNIFFLF